MQTITFYSYKGGVGRTLALANVAMLLAEMGKKVFVLDCDLEAPGMHYKLLPDEKDRDAMKPGFVDLSYEYFQRDGFKPIGDHVTRIKHVGDKVFPGEGEILLMPAGQPLLAEYWNRLVKINWPDRFYEEYGEGFLFLLELKRRIDVECKPDFLLIDARTGVTEVGGVALTLLPDKVVFLFVNNDESKEGTREIIRSIPRTLPEGEKLPLVVPVLTRIPEDMDPPLESLRAYLSEPVPRDVTPPQIERVLVLRSDRELERKEELYLGGDLDKSERVLYGDYDEFFGALALVSEAERSVLKLRALAEHAQTALRRGELDVAIDFRRKAMALAERRFGAQSVSYADALYEYAKSARFAGRHEEALDTFRRLDGIVAHDGIADAGRIAKIAGSVVLLSAQLGRFGDAANALGNATSRYRAMGEDSLVDFLEELRRLYETSRGTRHPSYALVLKELWTALIAADRNEAAEDIVSYTIEVFLRLREEGRLDPLDLANAHHARARLHKRRGDRYKEADDLQEVEKVYRASFGTKDPRWQEVRQELADAYDARGLTQDASAARRSTDALDTRKSPPDNLPMRRVRLVRGGPEIASFSAHLAVVTPILGGATRTREIDAIDVIRAPSLRGQLRFWWRALYGGQLSGEQLYDAERRLWGGAADEDGGRSEVEIHVTLKSAGAVDPSDVRPYGRDATPGAYALWPAREARGDNPQPTAPRRMAGTRFVLDVRCPKRDEAAVRNALRALVLFGGYGGRTRRGAGSFAIERARDRAEWLPAAVTRAGLAGLFGEDVLAPLPGRALDDLPLLRGAGLRAGAATSDPATAWTTALRWLSEFRQGQPSMGSPGSHDAGYARVRGDQRRPGRSNWPEADKVRRLSGRGPWAHEPRHNERPAWPRAGFGLPIVAQFQGKDREGARYGRREPEGFELRWYEDVVERGEKKLVQHDRLASPLIVKALPLADGRFAPCALWLYRGYPNCSVGLKQNDPRADRSHADFDVLVAPSDKALFAPLDAGKEAARGMRLRTAFFRWLDPLPGVVVVAP